MKKLVIISFSLLIFAGPVFAGDLNPQRRFDPQRIKEIMDEVSRDSEYYQIEQKVTQKYQNSWKGKRLEKKLSANDKKLNECREGAVREAGFELGYKILYKKCLVEYRSVRAELLKKKEKFLSKLWEKYQ